MPEPITLNNVLFEIGKDALLAGLAAWLTVKRALREFSAKRWWDRQEEAYGKIINSLSHIQVHLVQMRPLTAEYVSPEEQLRRWSTVTKRMEDLQRILHEGAFRISKASNLAIQELTTNWYPGPPGGEPMEQDEMLGKLRENVERCRAIIDAQARKDLGLPKQH
jgi:hypothetical protein